MAFDAPTVHFLSTEDKQKQKSVPKSTTVSEYHPNGCFDCNICLDSCHDPVVTLCGHLYCWSCIYKWLQVQTSSFDSDDQPKCPVCKAFISTTSLVPLYGRGTSLIESDSKKPQLDSAIPERPPALGINALLATATSITSDSNQQSRAVPFQPQHQTTFHQQEYFTHPINSYTSMAPPAFDGITPTNFLNPTINMVGEMVFASMFGSSEAGLFAYPSSNSYPFPENGSPRLRRQEMQLDKSLNRVSIFLFCCIALCLVLF